MASNSNIKAMASIGKHKAQGGGGGKGGYVVGLWQDKAHNTQHHIATGTLNIDNSDNVLIECKDNKVYLHKVQGQALQALQKQGVQFYKKDKTHNYIVITVGDNELLQQIKSVYGGWGTHSKNTEKGVAILQKTVVDIVK